MIDIAGIDVRSARQEQVDGFPRAREMQRRLTVPASLVHARRIRVEDLFQEIQPVQSRRRAGIGNGAGRQESVGSGRTRSVERMETAGPPTALAVRVGAEVEERHHDLEVVTGSCHQRGRVKTEQRFVDGGSGFRAFAKHGT